MKQQIAKINYLHIPPRKVRRIGDTIKGLSAQEAEAQLLLRPQRASKVLLGLLRSAVANARNNQKINPEQLLVAGLRVDQGPMLKRSLPRAMGRATPIQKKMSHVTLVLRETEGKLFPTRFAIKPPAKKEKAKKAKAKVKPKIGGVAPGKPKEKVGFLKRLFRRKSV